MDLKQLHDQLVNIQTLSDLESQKIAAELRFVAGGEVYPRSISCTQDWLFCLARSTEGKHLVAVAVHGHSIGFPDTSVLHQATTEVEQVAVYWLRMDELSAGWLRGQLDWLIPRPLGTALSVGCGDRLGLATPGHIHAVRNCSGGISPIFAQQSIREMTRTSRTPRMVIDDAMWGVFQEGWRNGYGADADHLKSFEDIDRCVSAGFTFYTFDPGAHVDNEYAEEKYTALPWADLESTASDLVARYRQDYSVNTIQHGMVKYGRAIAHLTRLYRYVKDAMTGRPFEVEISVDETDQPTSRAEHHMIASELRRLGVEWVSLAPRFVGRFEKGVDYIGDLTAFETDCAGHAQVAREFGPYKLSIHSGSDKFSIYPIVSRLAGRYVHLKTAGTSYLEALRTVARCDRSLFQKAYALAHERYAADRASYHVSAQPERAPASDLTGMADAQSILDQFDAREMLHVCFGSILARYGAEIKTVLIANEEIHYADLERHFNHHLSSFC